MEQHMPVFGVGVAPCHQFPDQVDDRGNVLSDARLQVGCQHPQRPHILVVSVDVAAGDGADGHPLGGRRRVDLVVHVSEVAGIDHLAVVLPEQPGQHVEHHGRPCVADVGEVVDRGAAHVHRHPVGLPGA